MNSQKTYSTKKWKKNRTKAKIKNLGKKFIKSPKTVVKIIRKNKNANDKRGYAYTNTRIRAMKHELLSEQDYQKIMRFSNDELARFLGETSYRKEINELGINYSGAVLLEYSLNKNLENTFKKIYGFSMKNAKEQIKLYLRKWKIFNVKTILRGKLSKTNKEELRNNLIIFDKKNKNLFENVIENAETYEEAIDFFKHEPFYEILITYHDNIGELEDKLDKFYYNQLIENSQSELLEYVADEVKILNELNAIRAKNEGLEEEEIGKYLIEGFDFLKKKKFKSKKMKKEEQDNPLDLRKKLLKEAIKKVHTFKRTLAPILGYFLAKENEVRNLRLIIRGKHNQIDSQIIEQQLVI